MEQSSFYDLWEEFTENVSALVIKAYSRNRDIAPKLLIWGGGGTDPTGLSYSRYHCLICYIREKALNE
jgi:hypothetical protein